MGYNVARLLMDYKLQQRFLIRSRIWGGAEVALLLLAAATFVMTARSPDTRSVAAFLVATVALAGSLFYSPDYLHLTVNPLKAAKWEIKIRWRVIGAALVLGLALASGMPARLAVLGATVWFTVANVGARFLPPQKLAAYFWGSDLIAIVVLLAAAHCDLLLATVLLAAASHLSILLRDRNPFRWAVLLLVGDLLLLLFFARQRGSGLDFDLMAAAMLAVAAVGTAWLVHRAQVQNAGNIDRAIQELIEFTGYSKDRIWHLWAVSNQELARQWMAAALEESDRDRVKQWYRDHSELYMFAISGYNLEYKRIRSNLGVLKLARGACLDYGAGNGEIVLELARRGHPATYYDVEGQSMKFARQRALKESLPVNFAQSKEELLALTRARGFDTIFSLDVLEHIPDLPAELNFLAALMSGRGRLVFDVPAGATKSHPMHLNHNLDVCAHLQANGFTDERPWWQRPPLRKVEKYVYRAPETLGVGIVVPPAEREIPNGFYRVSIKGLILDESRKKFAVILEDNGWWELPGGGLDWGESPEACLKREIREEMGLIVTAVSAFPSYYLIGQNMKEQWTLNLVFEVKVNDLNFTPSEECRDLKFISPDEVSSINAFRTVKELAAAFKVT